MKAVDLLERTAPSDVVANAADESAYTLDIEGVRLQDLASKAELNSVPAERRRPVASLASSMKLLAEQAGTPAQERREFHGQYREAYYHSGLNE
jgi:hypothetical protein